MKNVELTMSREEALVILEALREQDAEGVEELRLKIARAAAQTLVRRGSARGLRGRDVFVREDRGWT